MEYQQMGRDETCTKNNYAFQQLLPGVGLHWT